MQNSTIRTDVLIVGGGTSGVCAAIQAVRLGMKVVVTEETPWLGGMLNAAGVSAVDGNHKLPSGLWGEFRKKLYDYYGGPDAVKTGWVSNTLFEPRVGDKIFKEMVQQEKNIKIFYECEFVGVLRKKNDVTGAIFKDKQNTSIRIEAKITIDATEYGDLVAVSGCDYDVGRDAQRETGEPQAPEAGDQIIQDLTYVAILKDFGEGENRSIPEPPDYDPSMYQGMCREVCDNPKKDVVDCKTMLNYGRLPNNKFMINWPNHGNDFYLDYLELSRDEREAAFQHAKNFTLGWIYFVQQNLGWKNIGIADDEFPTADGLALIPYIRESRRVKGVDRLTTNELVNPYRNSRYQSGIAVGDYPLDHHHEKSPAPVKESFPEIPAFNVPFGCLIPQKIDGLLVAEKSISVTHLVNGCTRLHPVVMQIGQAAGAAAAVSIQHQMSPRQINVREVQQVLLDAGCWLMPFCDEMPSDEYFQEVQRVALCGILKGEPLPKDWANEMHFQPEKTVSLNEANEALKIMSSLFDISWKAIHQLKREPVFGSDVLRVIIEISNLIENKNEVVFNDPLTEQLRFHIDDQDKADQVEKIVKETAKKEIRRDQFAAIIDAVLDPFQIPLYLT